MITFTEKDISTFNINPFTKIDGEWMLITAGNKNSYNTMTASWGGFGTLWNKSVATCYVRPQRYTREFLDNEDYFTLSFYEDTFRPALATCGRVSGRDTDKAEATGLAPIFTEKAPFFKQALLVVVCKKIYKGEIDPKGILNPEIDVDNYPKQDYHNIYIGEVVKILEKKFEKE